MQPTDQMSTEDRREGGKGRRIRKGGKGKSKEGRGKVRREGEK